jgi:hypothetical protein
MNRDEMAYYLRILNEKLRQHNMRGEIGIFGGAVMCLGLNAREMTHDIDAVFKPKAEMRHLIAEIAEENGLSKDWLNDGVKGFTSTNNDMILFDRLSNIDIYMTRPEYLFSMKCLSCRTMDKNELNDIRFLVKYLNITSIEQAFDIIRNYYPDNMIKPKTQYMLMEILNS